MKRFVVPPNWPPPPRRSWVPPKTWRPDPAWPPAPAGWRFWVDGKGRPVTGPVGRYAAPSTRTVVAGASALVLFGSVNLWGLSAMGLFDGDEPAARVAPGSSASASASESAGPTTTPTTTLVTPRPSSRPSARPTARPTKARATTQPSRAQQRRASRPISPTPTTRPTVRPSAVPTTRPPTARPSTPEEIFAAYCRRQGWEPRWCQRSHWPGQPSRTPRSG